MTELTALLNDSHTVGYLPTLEAAIRTNVAAPTSPVVKPLSSGYNGIEPWGTDNQFPQQVLADVRANSILGPVLDWKARALYQGGLVYGYQDFVESNGETKEVFTPKKDPVVEEFLRRSNIRRYLIEGAADFYYFYNVFPELILSKDRKQIVSLSSQESAYCRWGKQDPKTGLVDTCYINANWPTISNPENEYVTKVPVLDPYYDPVGSLQADRRGYKYIYPVSYPTPGNSFYQLAHWDSLRTSGWLDVAQAVPAFKKALFKNQISIKYLIEVSTWYWDWKYPGFEKKTPDERKSLMQAELQAFETFMSGTEKAGNSLMTTFVSKPEMGKEFPGWKITAIDNKIKDGIYIEDSKEASSHLLFALGVDPTLIGATPGREMGAGSGSDKNAAFNAYISLCQAHQDLLLEPLHFVRDYNGWDPNLTFKFRRQILAPQTSGKPQLQEVK